jgi:hypothetical protein
MIEIEDTKLFYKRKMMLEPIFIPGQERHIEA